jgi:hypothetical protein
MKVLVACEFSGIVRDAFIEKGHDAVSVDLRPSESDKGPHGLEDIMYWLSITPDNQYDIIIAHPPCTCLCVSGNATYAAGKPRYEERLKAVLWTDKLWRLCKKKGKSVCFENPKGVLSTLSNLGKPAQYIQPYQFGHTETKYTGLWLWNLERLIETDNVKSEMEELPNKEKHKVWYEGPGRNRAKNRSRFFTGIAKAMADQWG